MSFGDRIKKWLAGNAARAGPACEPHMPGGSARLEEDEAVAPFAPFPEPVALPIEDVIDLHAFQPRDIKRVVESYLEEAHRADFPSVRIIHGKGRGVQRELVRKILSRTPYVLDYMDAPPEAGGIGATIAHLRRRT